MDKHLIYLVAAWFGTAFISLIFSLTLMVYLNTGQVVKASSQDFKLYAALPASEVEYEDSIVFSDARAKIIENFFKGYDSLLAGYSETFLEVADKYDLDYRLLPAISMQESNGAKRIIKESYNPFGYGIYGDKVVKFASWEEAIERVGKALRENYLDAGLTAPEEIMIKYTPPSLAKGGAWAKGVSYFMEEMK